MCIKETFLFVKEQDFNLLTSFQFYLLTLPCLIYIGV